MDNKFQNSNTGIQTPGMTDFGSIEELFNELNSSSWTEPGIILISDSGEKLRIEGSLYNHIKTIKGNMISKTKKWELKDDINPASFRILQIMNSSNIEEFLYYFPEYQQVVSELENKLFNLTNEVWNTYRTVYMMKKSNLTIKPELTSFMNTMHWKYHVNGKKPNNFQIAKEVVKTCPTVKLMSTLGMINSFE